MEYNFRDIEKKWQQRWVDNKTYKVTMKKEVPTPTDTVAIRFSKSANAAYYPWLDNDLLLANSNQQFYAGLDVVGVELGGEFTMEDLDLSYSLIFTTKRAGGITGIYVTSKREPIGTIIMYTSFST